MGSAGSRGSEPERTKVLFASFSGKQKEDLPAFLVMPPYRKSA
jgi:hypothetical protein